MFSVYFCIRRGLCFKKFSPAAHSNLVFLQQTSARRRRKKILASVTQRYAKIFEKLGGEGVGGGGGQRKFGALRNFWTSP